MSKPEIALIVARARNGVIGRNNALPWRLRDDLQQFKRLTQGHTIIMGRKTWESLGRLLPNRRHIVISRQPDYHAEGITVVDSLPAAIAACSEGEQAFIIGGAQIYAQSLDLVDVLWITEVDAEVEGDAYFPAIPAGRFTEASRQHFDASEVNDYPFNMVEYRRCK